MISKQKTNKEKEAIIAEYLLGEKTFRQMQSLHGVDYRIIHSWVTKFKGHHVQKLKTPSETIQSFEQQECDVKALREELRKAKLYNELLNTMIDIAEDQLKIDIRKKSGTKR